jgi:hypothetical protein
MSTPGAQSGSTELTRLQRWFQSVITHSEGVDAGACAAEAQQLIQLAPSELELVVTRSRALTAAERLAIYANAYHSRLLECLGEVYPMLKRSLGDEAFDAMAFGYLQVYPSKSYTLNELGRHFPRYLQQTRPTSGTSEEETAVPTTSGDACKLTEDWPNLLIDLARLEWAIYEVFDGPGVEGAALLDPDQILGISPERWPLAKLTPVVCLQLLETRFPVNDYYTALRRAKLDDPVPIPAAGESFVALTRRDYVVRRYPLSRPEFALLKALKEGSSVGDALESIVPLVESDVDKLAANLQTWFRNWTAEGFFQTVSTKME